MPADFSEALAFVLKHEGVDYTNDPRDAGGATKFGLSLRWYRQNVTPEADPAVIAELTHEEAANLYKLHFWARYSYGVFEQPIANKVFDMCVNLGPERAHRALQRALRACGMAVVEDGVLGAETVAGAERAHQAALRAALRSEHAALYRLIEATRGAYAEPFMRGWLKRAYA